MKEHARILLVEDSDADIGLVRLAIEDKESFFDLHTAHNGAEGLDYLQYALELPDVILLDLNMPQMDGKQFLALLKQDERFTQIPVIMLTSSGAQYDIQQCYELCADCYIVKPSSYKGFHAMMDQVKDFYLTQQRQAV